VSAERQRLDRRPLEFKQEAVRLVESGLSIAEAARSLAVAEQTLSNRVKGIAQAS
jgi:transposase